MQRFSGIYLLLCLILPLIGSFAILEAEKYQVRKEIKHRIIAGIDKSELTLLKIPNADLGKLHWEHSREFEYQDQMYDVVCQKQLEDTTYYWCWQDHKETRLNKQLALLLEKTMNTDPVQKQHHLQLGFYIFGLFFQQQETCQFISTSAEKLLIPCLHLRKYYSSAPATPPPRLI